MASEDLESEVQCTHAVDLRLHRDGPETGDSDTDQIYHVQ